MDRELHKARMTNIRKMQALDLVPRFIDETNSDKRFPEEMKDKVPFSKYYRTYSEYLADIQTVQRLAASDKYIPDDIFNKLLETNKELGI